MRKGAYYDISDYDIKEDGTIINNHNGHVVKPQKNGKGYMRVSIGGKLQFVHRLVANKYVPNPDNKPQVNHKDGNKLNNIASNLEWVTNQENRDHAVHNHLYLSGDKCPYAKLTRNNVEFIRAHKDISAKELAAQFHVAPSTIRNVHNMYIWKN